MIVTGNSRRSQTRSYPIDNLSTTVQTWTEMGLNTQAFVVRGRRVTSHGVLLTLRILGVPSAFIRFSSETDITKTYTN